MKDFIKLSKLYFIINMKIYLYFIGISLIGLNIMLGIFLNVRDVPFDYTLIIFYGFIGTPLLGLLAFTNNKQELYFIINRNRIRQLVVILIYPVITVAVFCAYYISIRRGDGFEIVEIFTKTGFVAGTYFFTILLAFQLLTMRKEKKLIINSWVVIIIAVGWSAISRILDYTEDLTYGSNDFLSVIGIILSLAIALAPITYVVYLYRKLEV